MEAETSKDYRVLRKRRAMNQQQFWNQVWVTQSGGSRYENQRSVPAPIAELVRLHHELDIDTRLVTLDNAPLIRAVLSGGAEAASLEEATQQLASILDILGELTRQSELLAGKTQRLAARLSAS